MNEHTYVACSSAEVPLVSCYSRQVKELQVVQNHLIHRSSMCTCTVLCIQQQMVIPKRDRASRVRVHAWSTSRRWKSRGRLEARASGRTLNFLMFGPYEHTPAMLPLK